jgi:ribosomal protein S18 acetylase RimI-like enzyme
MDIQIRKANKNDILSICTFQIEMAWETERYKLDGHIVQKGVSKVLENEQLGSYYIAEVNNQVVASLLTTFEWSDWRNATVLWIQSVYVMPDFRKRGIYGKLYQFVKEMVENNTLLCGVRLYVDKSNHAAQEVYTRLGMNGDHYRVFEWMK